MSVKMMSLCRILVLLAGGYVPLMADDLEYKERFGLFGNPEFQSSNGIESSSLEFFRGDFLSGHSDRFNGFSQSGSAAWIADVSNGVTYRAGLYDQGGGNLFTASNGTQISYINVMSESGYLTGASTIFNGGGSDLGEAAWITNGNTGDTFRVGFYDQGGGNEFTGLSGFQYSYAGGVTNTGYTTGISTRYNGGNLTEGYAAWVASAQTGITTRIGLDATGIGNEFIGAGGLRSSEIRAVNGHTGDILGSTTRYNGTSSALGEAVWIANVATPVATRIGLFDQEGGNEFTDVSGKQISESEILLASGHAVGVSVRYGGSGQYRGEALWIADVNLATTTRVGLYDAGGVGDYTNGSGYQHSGLEFVSHAGYLSGYSERYVGSAGTATWAADTSTGVTTRIGLFDAGGGNEFTSANGAQDSLVRYMTPTGYIWGASARYNGTSTHLGEGIWIADASTGITNRVGLFDQAGNEFLKANGSREEDAFGLSDTGYIIGLSGRYNGGSTNLGTAAWVGKSGGPTLKIGLYDPIGENEFTHSSGSSENSANVVANSGHVLGVTTRFNGGSVEVGTAAWLADGDTGETHRIGFFDNPEFTSSTDREESNASRIHPSGKVVGGSTRYNGASDAGNALWIADSSTFTTTRIGLFGSPEYRSLSGYEYSELSLYGWDDSMSEYAPPLGRFIAGYSERYNGDNSQDGQTAWVFDFDTNIQVNFNLSMRASDEYAYSEIYGLFGEDILYGMYTLFDLSGVEIGDRPFLWSPITGTVKLNEALSSEIASNGWDHLKSLDLSNGNKLLAGFGVPLSNTSSEGVYAAEVVPEPSSLLLLLGASGMLMLRRRK